MPRFRAARTLAVLLAGCAVLAVWGAGEAGPAPQPTAAVTAAVDTHCPTTAARRFGWGDPTRSLRCPPSRTTACT